VTSDSPAIEDGELTGKVALITGGGRGIGLATARALARLGAGLVLADRTFGTEAHDLLAAVRSSRRVALCEEMDLAAPRSAEALQAMVLRTPAIDVLVNNAGRLQVRPFLEVTLAEWQMHLDVNLSAMFLTAQAVLPGMLARGGGRIINISSELALTGMANYVAYCASKGGVIGFTRALAREYAAAGIRVNAVAPGPTVTPMLTEMTEEYTEEVRLAIPAQRFGLPEDVARTVAFLAGRGGDFYVGQVLSPNGGTVI
jgi:NAD(P)-dependent dehydrogenase (short-subunit alcohol dehydrogenase family)